MDITNISVPVETSLLNSAESLFQDMGLTLNSAINVFLRCSVNYDGIPFEIRRNMPNQLTKSALAEYSEMKNNPEKYKRYKSFDELAEEVLSDA